MSGHRAAPLLLAALLACGPAEREAPPEPAPDALPRPAPPAPAGEERLRDSVRAGPIFEVPAPGDTAGPD